MKKQQKDYTHQSLRDEREYGFYWYSGLWAVLRPILVILGALIVVMGVVMSGWNYVNSRFFAAVDSRDTQEIIFTVDSGSSLTRVSQNLESQNLIHNSSVFKYYCDFLGFGQKIQAGEYKLTRAMDITELIEQLTTGDGKPITRKITVIPGWNIDEIAAKLVQDKVLADASEFLNLCKTAASFTDYYYVDEVLKTPNISQRKYVLEGYLAPNTYEVFTNASAESIIKKLLSQTEAVYPAAYHDRAAELNMTMDQIITLASLIEKEAKTADFTKVSAIFHNRLKDRIALGSDVTIHYVTGVRKMALTADDLKINSLYNTYQNKGLPLGPICSPSQNAITAALYPDETFIAEKYLYFCSKDPNTGELHFSKTLAEHEDAVKIYAPLWRQFDESRGL